MKSSLVSAILAISLGLVVVRGIEAGETLEAVQGTRTQTTIYQDQREVAAHHAGTALDKPYLHPLWTPSGGCVTYDAPADHFHHRGLCVGWADVSNTDFWAEIYSPQGRRGKILTEKLEQRQEENGAVSLVEHNVWLQEDGTSLLSSRHIWTFLPARGNLQLVDVDLQFTALQPEVVFGSDPNQPRPYHGLCFRIGPFEEPLYFNSNGDKGGENCMGKAAKWCALAGKQRGQATLAAILDSPNNSSHPTRFAVYHQGMQFISSSPNFSEPKVLKQGETWQLQYRVVAAGPAPEGQEWDLESLWQEYAESVQAGK